MKSAPSTHTLLLLLIAASSTNADYSAEVGHSSEFSNNADLSSSNEANQREDRTWIELGLNEVRDNWLLQSDYQLTAVNFDSQSDTPQSDTNEVVGTTLFSLAGVKNRARLDISHRRERLLGSPGELELQTNFQERDNVDISPRWFFQNNSRQQVYFEGVYNKITYRNNNGGSNGINSTTQGIQLGALRRVSQVNRLGVQLQQQTTKYEDNLTDDNRYTSLVTSLSRDLRQLSYSVVLGFNHSELSNGRSLSAPQFSLTAGYDNGITSIEHATQYFITDTSRGNSSTLNQDSNQDTANLGNGNTNTVSRYELVSSELNLLHKLNPRWTVGLLLQASQQDHQEDTTQDRRDSQVLARINHKLNSRWDWTFSTGRNQQKFLDDRVSDDNNIDRYSFSLSYRPTNNMRTRAILNHNVRASETSALDYTENTALLEITYKLHP